jgi:phage tail tape-measure protein
MAISTNDIKIKYVIDDSELRKAATSFDKLTQEEQDAINSMKKFNTELGNTGKKATETGDKLSNAFDKGKEGVGGLSKSLGGLGPAIVGAFSVTAVLGFAKAVFDTTANFEKLGAVLKNTLGSGAQASLALEGIKEFAKTTPFAVAELTASFVKLANQGFVPTTNQLRKLGDLASSTGKGFDQLTEAIIDAQVGEFERLKDFGIRASKAGDQVKFTFKDVETQVKFNNTAIREYILSLGDYE